MKPVNRQQVIDAWNEYTELVNNYHKQKAKFKLCLDQLKERDKSINKNIAY